MNITVFSAHPDDAEFSMGGTLLLLSKKHNITLVVWTNGGAGTYGDANTREQEQRAAANKIGAKLQWLGNPDCSLEHNKAQIMKAAQIIRDTKPDIIFSPHYDQTGDITDGRAHPDHRNIGLVVKDAARMARFNIPELQGEKHKTWQIYYYMLPQHKKPNISICIDEVREELKQLWKLHASQNQLQDGNLCETLLAWRAGNATGYPGATLVELFDSDKPVLINHESLLDAVRD